MYNGGNDNFNFLNCFLTYKIGITDLFTKCCYAIIFSTEKPSGNVESWDIVLKVYRMTDRWRHWHFVTIRSFVHNLQ